MIIKAFEKREEAEAWDLYVSKFPFFTQENYVPFDKFYSPKKVEDQDHKTEEEILTEVQEILDSFMGGGEVIGDI